MNRFVLAVPLAASLLLGGCLSFGPKVPATLFDLTPDAVAAPGSGTSGTLESAILVLEPEAAPTDVALVPSARKAVSRMSLVLRPVPERK